MDLWLVRHGTTGYNLQGRLQGTLDIPLDDQGRKEAFLLAKRLEKQKFSYFFSSPLQRTKETSSIISGQGRFPKPIYTSLIEEYAWGIIQGLTKEEIGNRYPELWLQLQRSFHHTEIPQAEGMKRLFQRIKSFYALLSGISSGHEGQDPILIVSHGRFIQAFIVYFIKYNYHNSWPFPVSPASLTILQEDFQKTRRVKLFNDVCHLDLPF
jgi:broad specificity phosphatase PhoE